MPDVHFLNLKDNKIVLFADIIGFSNTVLESEKVGVNKTKGIIVNVPSIYHDIMNWQFPKEYQKELGIKMLWVSDSIIISTDLTNANNLIKVLIKLMNDFYCASFVLRGAICVGKLYHEENVWGVPLVNAVKLEKEKAKYPRIIISEDEFNLITLDENLKKNFKYTEYGNYLYLDFFNAYMGDLIHEEKNICSFLGVYTSLIVEQYLKCEKDCYKVKWIWLANQLKEFIINEKEYIDSLLKREKVYNGFKEGGSLILSYKEYLDNLKKVK